MARITRLREHRATRGLTQAKLAILAGVDPDTVSKAEQGRRVSVLTQGRLARALGVGIEELFPEEVGAS